FEYYPGVPLFHSRDLVHWRQIGHCLTRPSQLPLEGARSSGGIFAPTIRYHDGVFYMVTTNVTGGGHFYVHTCDPYGEWSEPVWVDAGVPGIDPSLLFDDDGTVYFTATSRQGIIGTRLDIATGRRLQEPERLWSGTGGQFPEAPHLYHIGDYYYLMLAEGGTERGHMITIARSTSPWGPFESCPYNPILSHRSTNLPLQATGHGDLIQAHDGIWWMVFLAVRPAGSYPEAHHIGRETCLSPVRWTEDSWPIVGEMGLVRPDLDVETLPLHPWPDRATRDDFDAPNLDPTWNFLRNPYEADWSLSERPGWLRLKGSAVTPDDLDSPAWVGRRQQHLSARAETWLEFDPQRDGEEAGLMAFMNDRHHYEVAVIRRDGARFIIVRRRIGSLRRVVAREMIGSGPVHLRIEGTPEYYEFSYALGDGSMRTLARGETRYLATEVAGGFTGVYLAMYATGNGEAGSAPADFDWFEYEGIA
ncbi:MAG TPA: glycoside hydrolase family 43 protein, partial [Chloroflexi bacterium]|nr:glycoside hydrolase family 43 protein [Chloroflexota bacterium]